jgi:signal transduction histidine kinase/ActR/RegA family two-component response regulator
MPALHTVLRPDAWRIALEKYGASTGTTVGVYESPAVLALGPVHATPTFEAVGRGRPDPAMFSDCVRQCLPQRDTPIIIEEDGVAVFGIGLNLAGEAVGAVVAGYCLTAFPEEASVRRFTRRHGLPLSTVWRAIRAQAPVTRPRLRLYAELLAALTQTLLSENLRSQQYEQMAARLAEANQAKDHFLAMLSHELRNPLAPIRIAMQVISTGGPSTPEVQKARQIVDRQVAHLTRLLDDLLDVSRITTGKINLRKEPVNLATAVANALEASRNLIQEREHSLYVSLPEAPIWVDADPVRLEQVITNLLNNAARYTPPKGHIRVSASRENADAVLRVRDDGVGIPAHLLSRVFDLFTQGERSVARSEGGLGIGLTIVRNLVELHGGSATVASEGPGWGCEFVVRLPLGKTGEVSPEPPATASVVLPILRILVIEDNADSREMLRSILELEGHRVEVAEDGTAGLEAARSFRPDVAVIDIGLPGLDGYEVGRRIRSDLGLSAMLIALTGYGQAEDRRRSEDAGFDAHLVKPVTPEQIREVLVKTAMGIRMNRSPF